MITIKNIVDYTDDQLFFELQVNRAAEVDITCKPEKIVENKFYQEDDICFMNEYITEVSEGYMRLISFIKNENKASYGMCPGCKKTINFNVSSSKVDLPEKVCGKFAKYYNDEFSQETIEWIPEASDAMRERIEVLLSQVKFFDKYLKCPLCGNMYRVSFALEYNKEKNCIYLIKIGQYPSLHEFAVENMSAFNKVLEKLKCKKDYQNAIRLHTDGYDIASYVHLRRIIERVVLSKYEMYQDEIDTKLENQINDEIAEKAKEETDVEKKSEIEERVKRKYSGGFMYLDFAGKLKALNRYVPDFLINNSEVYSIVSAGIHSLEEEKCKEFYDTLKNAVDIILHEEEANRQREELKRRTRKEISQAVKEIKEEL